MKLRVSETKSAIDYLKGHPKFSEAVEVMKARTPQVFENQVTFKICCIDEARKNEFGPKNSGFLFVSYAYVQRILYSIEGSIKTRCKSYLPLLKKAIPMPYQSHTKVK